MMSDDLTHKKIDDVIECLVEAWGNIPDGNFCNSLTELGFCDAVSNCEPVNTSQGKEPDWSFSAEMHQLAACIIFHDGCWAFGYNSKCLSGIKYLLDHTLARDDCVVDTSYVKGGQDTVSGST